MAQSKYPAYGAPSKLAMSDDLPLRGDRRTGMRQGQAALVGRPEAAGAPQAIELRHLRYFTAVADAGSFTHAAERMFIAQPTLSQQIRRLEEIVGTPLLQRRREGLRLTPAGTVLLDASRTVLSLVDHEVDRLTAGPEALPAPLDVMSLGNFEPDTWVPSRHPAARRGTISLDELARMDVIHGPRRLEPGIYDAWTRVLRAVNPRFEFTDPPLRHSLPMALAFATTADRSTAVLTGPGIIAGSRPGLIRMPRAMVSQDMVLVGLDHHPLTATAAMVWNGDLPRPLQQVLFDAADGITPSAPAQTSEREPAAIGV